MRMHDFLDRIGRDPVKYALRIVFVLGLLLLVFLVVTGDARAAPLLVAELKSGKVTLTDEPCALKAVTNVPKRVTWLERDGKLIEGCYGLYTARLFHGDVHFVIGYFSDLTLQVLPLSVFSSVNPI